IFKVQQFIPVASSGPITLQMPEWLPGTHAPRGQIEKMSGFAFSIDGKPVSWKRDPLNVYGFIVDVPEGAREIEVQFQFLSATQPNQGRVVVTPKMLNIQWESV